MLAFDRQSSVYSLSVHNLGAQLKSVESARDLGVTISYDLSWSKHVPRKVSKLDKV